MLSALNQHIHATTLRPHVLVKTRRPPLSRTQLTYENFERRVDGLDCDPMFEVVGFEDKVVLAAWDVGASMVGDTSAPVLAFVRGRAWSCRSSGSTFYADVGV